MPIISKYVLAAILLAGLDVPMFAQKLILGAAAGTSISGDYESGSYRFPGGTRPDGQTTYSIWTVSPSPRSLIIGPKLELKLPRHFSVEADALHRVFHSRFSITEFLSGGSQFGFGPFPEAHTGWEFPLLAKYTIPGSRFNPFLEAGPSLRSAGSGTGLTHWGAAAGAGVDLHLGVLDLAPTLRYTHWKDWPGGGPPPIQIVNQVEVLAGLQQATEGPSWTSVFGRRFSVGLLAGAGLGDDLHPTSTSSIPFAFQGSDSNSGIFGALLEVNAHKNVFVEANGLYRPLHGYDTVPGEGTVRFAVLTWEFPVLAKYKFRPRARFRPIADLGPSFRLDGNFNGPMPSHYGVAGGVGLEGHIGRFKASPLVRYTRWGKERTPRGGGTFLNEVECLMALSI